MRTEQEELQQLLNEAIGRETWWKMRSERQRQELGRLNRKVSGQRVAIRRMRPRQVGSMWTRFLERWL